MYKINSYKMVIHMPNGSTVCTPDKMAMAQRVTRLKRELSINLKASK